MQFSLSAVLASLAGAVLALGASAVLAQTTAPSPVALVDRIVAVVNREVITAGEIAQRTKTVTQQLRQQKTPLPPEDVLQKQVLERMITDRLQLQLAKETALRVDDLQLDRTVSRVAESNKLSLTDFRSEERRVGKECRSR